MEAMPLGLPFLLLFTPAVEPAPLPREVRFDLHGDALPEGTVARLGSSRLRTFGPAAVSFSADGKTFATYGDDARVREWKTATGDLLHVWDLPGTFDQLRGLSPGGRRAAIEQTFCLEIWDLAERKCLHKLPLRDAASFSAVAFSADGRYFATADFTPREHRIRIWDLETGKNRVIGATEEKVLGLAIAGDGKHLYGYVAGESSDKGTLISWDIEKQQERWCARNEVIATNPIKIQVVDRWVFLQGPRSQLFEASTGKVAKLPTPVDAFRFVLPDGKHMIVRNSGNYEVIDIASGKARCKFKSSVAWGWCDACDPSGRIFVTADQVLRAWNLDTGKPIYPEPTSFGDTVYPDRITWSPDGKLIGSGMSWTTWVWDAQAARPLDHWEDKSGNPIWMAFDAGGRRLLRFGEFGVFYSREIGKNLDTPLREFTKNSASKARLGPIHDSLISPRRQVMTLWTSVQEKDRRLKLTATDLQVENEALYDLGPEPRGRLALSPDGSTAIGAECHLSLRTGLPRAAIESAGGQSPDRGFVFSPDSRLIAAGLKRVVRLYRYPYEGTKDIAVWERDTGRIVCQLPPGPAGQFTFSPNGRRLAVARPDGLHLYDLPTGKEVLFRKAHDHFDSITPGSFATALAFAPDGKRIATGHADTTILIWDVAVPPRAKPARLTDDEAGRLWADLASPDAATGVAAVWALHDHLDEAVALLRRRLGPLRPPPAAELTKLLAGLDAESFKAREAATRALVDLGDRAGPALKEAAGQNPPEDRRKRLERLLAELEPRNAPRGDDLRTIRALAVLEHIKTPAARKLIAEVAGGMESARATREAKEALERHR